MKRTHLVCLVAGALCVWVMSPSSIGATITRWTRQRAAPARQVSAGLLPPVGQKGHLVFGTNGNRVVFDYEVILDMSTNDLFYRPSMTGAVAPDGTLYLLDRGAHDIKMIRPNGRVAATFGGLGQAPGQWARAVALTVAPDGEVWLWDDGAERFVVYAGDGRFQRHHVFGIDMLHCVGFVFADDSTLIAAGTTYAEQGFGFSLHVFALEPGERVLEYRRSFSEIPDLDRSLYPRLGLASVALDYDGGVLSSVLSRFDLRKYRPDGTQVWAVDADAPYEPAISSLTITSSGGVRLLPYSRIRIFIPAGPYYLAQIDFAEEGYEDIAEQVRKLGGIVDPDQLDYSKVRSPTALLLVGRTDPSGCRIQVPAGTRGARVSFFTQTDAGGRVYAIEHRPDGYGWLVRGRFRVESSNCDL